MYGTQQGLFIIDLRFCCASSPLCFLYNGEELSVEYTQSNTAIEVI